MEGKRQLGVKSAMSTTRRNTVFDQIKTATGGNPANSVRIA